MGLEGKSAIVTGAGQGIGRAISLRLAQEGADVVVAELNPETARSVAAEIDALGRRGVPVVVDVTKAEDRARMVETALRELGQIDILVNNAGLTRVVPALDLTEQDWDRAMDLNAKACFFCCQLALKEMLKRKSGRVINIASQAGKMAVPHQAQYGASKAAVLSITRSLAMAVASEGITVNAICPGFVDTRMWEQMDAVLSAQEGLPPGGAIKKRIGMIPMRRFGTPDEVAGLVAFLASSEADYMTGQAINITGGFMLY